MIRIQVVFFGLLLLIIAGAQPAAAQYNWNGWYVGVNSGGAWGNSNVATSVGSSGTYFASTSRTSIRSTGQGDVNPGGFTGGAQGGYNFQTGSLVLGLEGDFEYLGQDETRSVGPIVYPCCSPTTYSIKQKLKTDNLLTLRPRAGWAVNNWLFYVTSGLALSRVSTSFQFTDTFAAAHTGGSKTSIRPGWTVGAGAEFGITANWIVRAEYLYVDLTEVGLTKDGLASSIGNFNETFKHKGEAAANIARIALNYKF